MPFPILTLVDNPIVDLSTGFKIDGEQTWVLDVGIFQEECYGYPGIYDVDPFLVTTNVAVDNLKVVVGILIIHGVSVITSWQTNCRCFPNFFLRRKYVKFCI